MLLPVLLLVITNIQVVSAYSIFGGNAYGYTGSSKCSAVNGCISQSMENPYNDGRPYGLYGSDGTLFVKCMDLDYDRTISPPSLMDVREDAFGTPNLFKSVKADLGKCPDPEKVDQPKAQPKYQPKLCQNMDEYQTKRLREIFEYQILYDTSVQNNYQGGGIFKWKDTTSAKSVNGVWKAMLTSQCDKYCFKRLLEVCMDVNSLRHVRDWCLSIHSLIDLSSLDQYQHGLLWLMDKVLGRKYKCNNEAVWGNSDKDKARYCVLTLKGVWSNGDDKKAPGCGSCKCCDHEKTGSGLIDITKQTADEKTVLISAALATVFLTKGLFDDLKQIEDKLTAAGASTNYKLSSLGYAAMHSLFLANYAGRLRVTLQVKPDKWGTAGSTLAMIPQGIEIAKNFEGLTGSAYASIAALFHNKEFAQQGKVRFRLEIGEINAIGCVEQTTGMLFVRPGDWTIGNGTKWVTVGPKDYRPGGLIAIEPINKTSTLEINEGGLVLYPVTIGDTLYKVGDSQCNWFDGNGPPIHEGLDLQGLGGICNWVPSW